MKMIQQSIRANKEVFELAKKIAKEESRSKNFILQRWLQDGMNLHLESKNNEKNND